MQAATASATSAVHSTPSTVEHGQVPSRGEVLSTSSQSAVEKASMTFDIVMHCCSLPKADSEALQASSKDENFFSPANALLAAFFIRWHMWKRPEWVP